MGVSDKVQEAGLILGGLGVIGFLGIIWLMIYGNLSGNLGFERQSNIFTNNTITLQDAGAIPNAASGLNSGNLSSIVITNATGAGELLTVGNYTVIDVTISNLAGEYNNTEVNVSGVVTFDSTGLANTEGVINNVSGGFGTFFGFSNTFFTIAAVVLLIFMLLGLLSVAMIIMRMQKSGGKFSGI